MSLSGHFWTVAPWLRNAVRPLPDPASEPWQARVDDPTWGPVRISGRLHDVPSARDVTIVIHGLGGCCQSYYALEAAARATRAGMSCLRLNLRGADRSGEDFYHGGILADVDAAIASPQLARYERVFLLGYSLGGHIALRYATIEPSPRLAGVASICSPLDLSLSTSALDDRALRTYLAYLLRSLKRATEPIIERRALPITVEQMRAIQTIREWDEKIVAPRWGYTSAEEYYTDVSARRELHSLQVPALLILSRNDPMILAPTIDPALEDAPPLLTTRWLETGGHVGFPRSLDLGYGKELGIHAQALQWLKARTVHADSRNP